MTSQEPLTPESAEKLASQLAALPDYRVLRRFDEATLFRDFDYDENVGVAAVLDTETTGRDVEKAQVIELGLVTFAYDRVTGRVLSALERFNQLEDPGVPIPPEATAVNNITDDMVRGQRIDDDAVQAMVEKTDFIIAHNAGFDRRVAEKRFPFFKGLPWACSHLQMDWEAADIRSSKLEFIAYRLGFFYEAHRAEADCLALLNALNVPLSQLEGRTALSCILERYRQEDRRIWAVGAPFDAKDALKARGYRWNDGMKADTDKAWSTEVSLDGFEEELSWLKQEVFNNRQFSVPVDQVDAFCRFSDRRSRLDRAYR